MLVTLTVIDGPHLGAEFSFDQHATFVVGRNRRAQFRLSTRDPYISRLHFAIENSPAQSVILNLSNRHSKTRLNSRKIERAVLAHGDIIRAGKSTFRVGLAPHPQSLETDLEPEAEPGESPPEIRGYRLDRWLGSGATGTVYQGVDLRDQSRVALKIIAPEDVSEKTIKRVEREAFILRQLDHAHIVSLFNYGWTFDRLYLAMEYVPGPTAQSLMAREGGFLTIGRAVEIASQALDALAYAHRAGFIHRDIKPNNLLIARIGGRDYTKVVDFGLARMFGDAALRSTTTNTSVHRVTATGAKLGTLGYSAPEQFEDAAKVDHRADIYAVGSTLYAMLTGELPYDIPKRMDSHMISVFDNAPRPIQKLRADIPPGLADVIYRSLAREPAHRWNTAREMQDELKPWLDPII